MAVVSCSDQTGPRAVDDIRLRPDSAHLEPGQTSVHQIVVLDEHDREMSAEWLPRIEWTLHTPELADMEVDGDELRVTAKAKGTVGIRAELGSESRSFQIFVRPPGLARIEVEPDPVVISTAGNLTVTTSLYDDEGVQMDPRDFRISWEISDTMLASVPFQNRANEGIVRVFGKAERFETGTPGKAVFVTRVSGELVLVDLLVTLEPTPVYTPPEVEVGSASSLKLVWPKGWDARRGYEVERAPSANGPWSHRAFTGSKTFFAHFDTTHVDNGLASNTTYFYRVRACNTHGCSVLPSPVGSGTTPAGE